MATRSNQQKNNFANAGRSETLVCAMKHKIGKRLYQSRWFWIVVGAAGVFGAGGFEVIWRSELNAVDPVASQWIKNAPIVRKLAGEVRSLETLRTWSNIYWGLGGEKTGRLHYLVHGSKDDLDLMILWRQKTDANSPIVEKVQWIDARGFDTIWP